MASFSKGIIPITETKLAGSSETSYLETIIVCNTGVDGTYSIRICVDPSSVFAKDYIHKDEVLLAGKTDYVNIYCTLKENESVYVSCNNSAISFRLIS